MTWRSDVAALRDSCVFVDRDGVINERIVDGYVLRWADFRWRPDALSALRLLAAADVPIVVISNQSCVGRGLLSQDGLIAVMAQMQARLTSNGSPLTGWYCCPHAPDEGCDCRKPKPGMFLRAAAEFGFDLGRSHMIGDADSDTKAAEAAGCPAIQIDPSSPNAFESAARAVVKQMAV